MVHGKAQGGNKATSPVRTSTRIRSARYQPTSRDIPAVTKPHRNLNQTWPSTIYKLNIPGQPQVQNTQDHSRPCPPHLLQSLKNFDYRDGARNNMSSLMRHNMSSLRMPRHEKSLLDKVEDMDVDSQSDQELCSTEESAIGMYNSSVSQSRDSESIKEKSVKTIKGNKNGIIREKELKKNCGNEPSSSTVKVKRNETIVKKKPVYIILHASHLRVGHLKGRAVQAVRIQAGKMLVEMELESIDKQVPDENLTLRIPCKELHGVKMNITEPPFLFVAIINDTYTKTLVEGSRNKILNKLKGDSKLQIIVHLMYDAIPSEVSQGLITFQSELGNDVIWEELSSTKAEQILSGVDKCKEPADEEVTSEVDAHLRREETKCRENRKRKFDCKTVSNVRRNDAKEQYNVKSPEKDSSFSLKEDSNETSAENEESQIVQKPPSPVVRNRRKRTFGETKPTSLKAEEEAGATVPEEKYVDGKKDVASSASEVVTTDGSSKSGTTSLSTERSFEEDRLVARQIRELQSNIVEKESMLTQQRQTVELRDLQLEQERNTVRGLRASLREEQRTKRDLEARYEAVNSELLVRNTRDVNVEARLRELEQELSQLNLSLNSSTNENERLVQEIQQVRGRLTENEESLRAERESVTSLQQEIETTRSTLEILRENLRAKDEALSEERALIDAASERNTQLQQQLVTTRTEYELRITRGNDEHQRTRREHEECSRQLASTRDQLQDANRALHRAQETVDEYSRMQPRDWTIARDEIVITDKVLGQGAWGWVKEGKFRGTMVAVKQMHELIVSPHNRRLFEREMQIAARCRHPNLLQFIGATGDNGLALLVTELLDTDLRTVLGQRALCHDEVVTIATDVSRALNYLHLNKPFPIIHRDISSTNVLLWKREDIYHAKLSDYGAANFMRQCMTVSPGACIYAAPEAVTSRQSTKVDVYSFGLLLCEMCIRELPVPGHIHEQIRSITNGHLRELVQRSTYQTPENRPTMSDVITALLRLSPNTSLGTISINNRHVV